VSYWQDRMAQAQDNISAKNTKQVERQLAKYYANATKKVMSDFEDTYNKLLAAIGDDREPTPADLYKLDKYWEAQAQMRAELRKLGEREIAALSKAFETNFFEVYYSIALDGGKTYSSIDTAAVQQLLSQVWAADGKSWSQRIWENTEELAEALNNGLIHTVAAGKKTTDLKNLLQERFNVSYSRADALVRTELGHIQTQAAQRRYEDYGIQYVQVWADKDERRCEICGKLHKKKYPIGSQMPIPAHPRCRCCIVPVVDE